jgi:hypothetical protein
MKSRWLAALLCAALMAGAGSARADDPANAFFSTAPRFFKICTAQTYALCAVASCFVLNGVSYCGCDVEHGDSISLPFTYGRNRNVCTINAEGAKNGYMVSTYSLPSSVVAPDGDQALYDCPAGSNGAYAQCDGGVCFRSSQGQSFPGFATPLAKNQIICSCPTTVANPQNSPAGYQIVGPYPCQRSFFRYCKMAIANTKTGSQIYVGAPTGVPRLLTRLLNGRVPPINECRLSSWP